MCISESKTSANDIQKRKPRWRCLWTGRFGTGARPRRTRCAAFARVRSRDLAPSRAYKQRLRGAPTQPLPHESFPFSLISIYIVLRVCGCGFTRSHQKPLSLARPPSQARSLVSTQPTCPSRYPLLPPPGSLPPLPLCPDGVRTAWHPSVLHKGRSPRSHTVSSWPAT